MHADDRREFVVAAMIVSMRGAAAMAGVLGLFLLVGCSSKASSSTPTGGLTSCFPRLTLFGPRPRPPKEVQTPLSTSIVSRFAILRRHALPSDEPSPEDLLGTRLDRELSRSYELSQFYPAYVRLLRRLAGNRRYFEIPGFARSEAVGAGCSPAELRRKLVEVQRRRLTDPVYCVIETGGSPTAPVPGCEPFAQIDESVRAFHVSDLVGEPTIELVPDGVNSVRVSYTDTRPVVAPVRENAFLLTPPPAPRDRLTAYLRGLMPSLGGGDATKAERLIATRKWNASIGGTFPVRIEWLDSAGSALRTLSPPAESTSTTSVGDLRAPIEG